MREIIVDGFAGGGGASTGIHMALGRGPDVAINHDAVAVAMHTVNHPDTQHYCQNIWKVNPAEVANERKIGLAWFSPDCKHFSKAKGGKPVARNVRDLAWIVVAYAKLPRRNRPRLIIVENVEEFVTWGPLGTNGRPCKDRSGEYFKKWARELRRLDYKVDRREIVAANKGSPTTRKRVFIVARNDGLPIVWPEDTHASPKTLPATVGARAPWRTAAECIDWSIPCPSIFDTSEQIMAKHGIRSIRPLADNTMARVARGVKRYVIDAAQPFIVPITHTGDEHALITPFVSKFRSGHSGSSLADPLCTVTANSFIKRPGGAAPIALVAPTLIQTGYGERKGQAPRSLDLHRPLGTVVNGQKHALVAAFLAKHYGDTGQRPGSEMTEPVNTITACDHHAVVSAGLINLKGSDRRMSSIDTPAPTQTAGGWHIAEVRAFLIKYFGTDQDPRLEEPMHTSTTKDRFGLVTVMIGGEPYAIVDIGMRMLTPRELFRAQGFPETYIIDRQADGTPISKTDQIRMCGNSVCPQVAQALVAANYAEVEVTRDGIPAFALEAAE